MRHAFVLLLLVACDPMRPMPPDAGPDVAPFDAPEVPDAGACVAVSGAYVGSSTCPGLGAGGLTACVAQADCRATLRLAVVDEEPVLALVGDRGTFSPGDLGSGVTCTAATWASDELRLECTDGAGIGCDVTLTRRAFEAEGVCCTSSAECAAGSGCTLVAIGGGAPETTACLDRVDMPRAEGESCTRRSLGDDDCAEGLFCTPLGTTGMPVCRALCRADRACDVGFVCASAQTAPRMGACVGACDPFAAAGCGPGLSCGPTVAIGPEPLRAACLVAGTAAEGEPCEATGCAAGLFCARNDLLELLCAVPCDDAHPCATGSCRPLVDGGMLGSCQ
jgi:hypothetical protein